MGPSQETSFTPPTPQQLEDHLRRCSPRQARRWVTMLPFAGLGMVIVLTFASDGLVSLVSPVLVLAALLVGLNVRVRLLRRLERDVGWVQEFTALRHYREAMARGWRLLPQLRRSPETHGRTVAAMAFCLDQLKAYDSAIVAYDYVLDMAPANQPAAVQLVVQRAGAQLMGDRLTDGDDALRRLRGTMAPYEQTPIGAGYRLAALIQQVRTNHFADAVAESADLAESLRPLGVDAGFGYALMALSHYMTGSPPNDAPDSPAAVWWARATMLLAPSVLIGRFDELGCIAHLPATPLPEPWTSR